MKKSKNVRVNKRQSVLSTEKLNQKLDKKSKATIDKMCLDLRKNFLAMDKSELQSVIRVCQDFTNTNCWYLSFKMRFVIMELAENDILMFNDRHKGNDN